LAVYLSREILDMSYEAIGDFFNKKHTTIMYSCDMVSDKIKTDSTLQTEIDDLKSQLKG
jgi:chromosomal replication initiator protein